LDIAREHVAPPVYGTVVDEESGAVVLHALNVLSHASSGVPYLENRSALNMGVQGGVSLPLTFDPVDGL
jgi:hypothetical protein